ncbi:MAG TPA: hypothetical protein VI565_03660, partial [Burkholderiales bacterium]|nr:hypothetical protein [Burkholderiales bacterium]
VASFRPDFPRVAALKTAFADLPTATKAEIARILGVPVEGAGAALDAQTSTTALSVPTPPGRQSTGVQCGGSNPTPPETRVPRENVTCISEYLGSLPDSDQGLAILKHAFDIPHAVTTTGANGTYAIRLPFSTHDYSTIRFFKDGVEIGSVRTPVSLSDADTGAVLPAAFNLDVVPGAVSGIAFLDANGNRILDSDESGVSVDFGLGNRAVTSNADGTYTVISMPPGSHQIRIASDAYELAPGFEGSAKILPNATGRLDLPLVQKPVKVSGTLWADANADAQLSAGEGQAIEIRFVPDPRVPNNRAVAAGAFPDANGTFQATLAPGSYVARADAKASNATISLNLTISVGQPAIVLDTAQSMMRTATRVAGQVSRGGNATGTAGMSLEFHPVSGGTYSVLHDRQLVSPTGAFDVFLSPGDYRAMGTRTIDGVSYKVDETITVGSSPLAPTFNLVAA